MRLLHACLGCSLRRCWRSLVSALCSEVPFRSTVKVACVLTLGGQHHASLASAQSSLQDGGRVRYKCQGLISPRSHPSFRVDSCLHTQAAI